MAGASSVPQAPSTLTPNILPFAMGGLVPQYYAGGGFARGSVTITGTGADRDRTQRLELQNENLLVREDQQVLVSVPDNITILDAETGHAITTESLRFGQRVAVLAWPCDPIWRTPRGLELAGPRAFGLDLDYTPYDGSSQ